MRVEDFDYHLPPELIAQEPLPQRDASRLLVLERSTGRLAHRRFPDVVEYLEPGDALVLNDTRVLPARLWTRRETGGRVELLLLHPHGEGDGSWLALARPARRARPGERLAVDGGVWAEVVEGPNDGRVRVRFGGVPDGAAGVAEMLRRHGRVPLPPYIRRSLSDPERYQTVYARREGAAAAPTAGLHFTPDLLRRIAERGVRVAFLTLHVGLGTFAPLRVEEVERGRLHGEWYEVTAEAAAAVEAARRQGRRVFAVGTTVVRALESRADDRGLVAPGSGWTELFIYPGFRFRVVDALITNFHLPRSSLLMLVAAFAGREAVLAAYREAVRQRYRFFSFGDAMLVL